MFVRGVVDTGACSGGDMYRPTMSSSFPMNCGSRETSKPRTTWGLRPLARQCREMLAALTPSSAAIVRVLQCVAALGLVWVVSSTSQIGRAHV